MRLSKLLTALAQGSVICLCLVLLVPGSCLYTRDSAWAASPDRLFVSVSSDPCDAEWNRKAAALIQQTLAAGSNPEPAGDNVATNQPRITSVTGCSYEALGPELSKARQQRFPFHYHLEKRPDGGVQLTLENWSREDASEFVDSRWSIEPPEVDVSKKTRGSTRGHAPRAVDPQSLALQELLSESYAFLQNRRQGNIAGPGQEVAPSPQVVHTPEAAPLPGVVSSPEVAPSAEVVSQPVEGVAADAGSRSLDSGARIASERGRTVYSNQAELHKDYVRASLETLGFLGVAAGTYWLEQNYSAPYKLKVDMDNFKDRFTGELIRFDLNSWETNVAHNAAGTGYYLLARSNDLSIPESMLFTVASSTLWEFFVELRDEVSVNDLVMTPFGGFATGEVLYQLGEFFQHSSDNIPNRALSILFSPSSVFNRWLDNSRPKPPDMVDYFGFSTDPWHRFRLYFGGGGSENQDTDKSRTETEMGFDFELVTAEKYGKPGEVSAFHTNGVFNQLAFRTVLSDGEIVDLLFYSKAALLGHYQQHIVKDEKSETLEGYSLFFGLSTAFEYYMHQFATDQIVYPKFGDEDKMAICDLFGPSLVTDYYHGGFHVRASVDAYPTFSMVMPSAEQAYIRWPGYVWDGGRSIFRLEGYYYALGMSTSGRLEMDYGPFELEGLVRYHYFSSIDGLDRLPEQVTRHFNLEDQRLWMMVALYYNLPIKGLKLGVDVEQLYRWSDIYRFSMRQDDTRFVGKLIFEF
jgi:hypothetical protein